MTSGEPHFGHANDRGARVVKRQDGPWRMPVSTATTIAVDQNDRFYSLKALNTETAEPS